MSLVASLNLPPVVAMVLTEKTMPCWLYPMYNPGNMPGRQKAVNRSSATQY